MVDVEAARRHVGGHEHVGLLGAEELHHAVALPLVEPAVQRLRAVAVRLQRVGEFVHFEARAAEDDRRGGILELEDAAEREALLAARHDVGGLADLRHLARRALLGLDRDALGLAQVAFGDGGDARRHRGGKERRLPRGRRGRENRLEVVGEAHVEHLVGFVEHEDLERREIERGAAQVIEGAAGRGHDDLDTAAQGADLLIHRRAAVERHHGQGRLLGVLVDRFGDLHRQLARGHEHEGARHPLLRRRRLEQPVQHRQGERGGLAGAGAGLADDVLAGQEHRNGGALDGGGFFVAEGRDGLDDGVVEAEGGESGLL